MKSRLILDTVSVGSYLFFLLFSIPQESQFPVQTSFQKPKVGRCKAGVCSQLSLGPHPELTSSPGRLGGTSWWGGGGGDHLLFPIVHQPIVWSMPSALRTTVTMGECDLLAPVSWPGPSSPR